MSEPRSITDRPKSAPTAFFTKLTGRAFPWALLVVIGTILLALQAFGDLSEPAKITLFLIGTIASITGGAGVGAILQQGTLDESMRLRMRPAFRRTFRVLEGLAELQYVMRQRRGALEPKSLSQTVHWTKVASAFDVVDSRLEEQLRSSDDAFLEWRDINPTEADQLWADLLARSEEK
jgi:hypothetical protein